MIDKQNQWEPIETVPKDCAEYLFTDGINYAVGCFNPSWISYDPLVVNPKYWMPLPELPKKKHLCENEHWICKANPENQLYLKSRNAGIIYWDKVNFCPLCGVSNENM